MTILVCFWGYHHFRKHPFEANSWTQQKRWTNSPLFVSTSKSWRFWMVWTQPMICGTRRNQRLDQMKQRVDMFSCKPYRFMGGTMANHPSLSCVKMVGDCFFREPVFFSVEHFQGGVFWGNFTLDKIPCEDLACCVIHTPLDYINQYIYIYMGVSKNRGDPKIIHFTKVVHYKPSICIQLYKVVPRISNIVPGTSYIVPGHSLPQKNNKQQLKRPSRPKPYSNEFKDSIQWFQRM